MVCKLACGLDIIIRCFVNILTIELSQFSGICTTIVGTSLCLTPSQFLADYFETLKMLWLQFEEVHVVCESSSDYCFFFHKLNLVMV